MTLSFPSILIYPSTTSGMIWESHGSWRFELVVLAYNSAFISLQGYDVHPVARYLNHDNGDRTI